MLSNCDYSVTNNTLHALNLTELAQVSLIRFVIVYTTQHERTRQAYTSELKIRTCRKS